MQTPVILSGANASRSEAFAESKDPLPASSATSSARSSMYALAVRAGNWQLGTGN
jgi:hypothetical protein